MVGSVELVCKTGKGFLSAIGVSSTVPKTLPENLLVSYIFEYLFPLYLLDFNNFLCSDKNNEVGERFVFFFI